MAFTAYVCRIFHMGVLQPSTRNGGMEGDEERRRRGGGEGRKLVMHISKFNGNVTASKERYTVLQ